MREKRVRQDGLMTTTEIARMLGVSRSAVWMVCEKFEKRVRDAVKNDPEIMDMLRGKRVTKRRGAA